jgi:hypothetical protein
MYLPIFSKRHKRLIEGKSAQLALSKSVRRRILGIMDQFNDVTRHSDSTGWNYESDTLSDVGQELVQEHGWTALKCFDSASREMKEAQIRDFMIGGPSHYIFDSIELFSRQLGDSKYEFQHQINTVLWDAAVPWRIADDIIFQVDSAYMAEVLECASRLLTTSGFEGAFEEFQKARAHLESSDTKESVHHANLALESTMKALLGIDQEKPGKLIRKMKDSGMIPAYYDEFLDNFEQILRSVNIARNEEKGAGHGQGVKVAEVPAPLAELVLNLCGALIVFLVKQTAESKRPAAKSKAVEPEDDIPF